MVPAAQVGVVAQTHTPMQDVDQDAVQTPVPIVESSSNSESMDTSRSSPDVQINQAVVYQHLQQQLNVSADPAIVSEASRVVIQAQSEVHHTREEAQRVISDISREADSRVQHAQSSAAMSQVEFQRLASLAESQVQMSKVEASRLIQEVVSHAEHKIRKAQDQANRSARDADEKVIDIKNKASAVVGQIQGETQSIISKAQTKISHLEESLQRSQSENVLLKQQMIDSEGRQKHQAEVISNLQIEFERQVGIMQKRVQDLESRSSAQPSPVGPASGSHGIMSSHHGAIVNQKEYQSRLPVTSGTPSHKPSLRSELLQRTGDQQHGPEPGGLVTPQVQMLQYTGDDLVNMIFGETPAISPEQRPLLHNQQPAGSPKVEMQLEELSAKVDSLANIVHNFATGAVGSQRSQGNPSRRGTPPNSPPGSSSSSSSHSSRKSPPPPRSPHGTPPGSPPKGSPASKGSGSSSVSSRVQVDPYTQEKKLMRIKGYDTMKLPNLPKNAAEVRTFRNGVYNLVCKMAKGDEAPVFQWISRCSDPDAVLSDSMPYPILDRVLGNKLLELSKGTRFAMHFQSLQEEAQKSGRQPKGRKLLWVVFEKYKMEKDKGVALTQSHLLGLKLSGNDIKALEDFRSKFDYIWQALEPGDRPSESATRSHLFEQLKNHPKLHLTIDKYRNASSGSSKRSSQWLYGKLIEAIEIHQLEENSTNIEKSLSSIGQKVDANPAKNEKQTKTEKTEKPKTEKPSKPDKTDKPKEQPDKSKEKSKSSKDDVNAAAAKGKGKGNKEDRPKKDSKGKKEDKDKSKQPCMYYGYNACTKGDQCPYLHDPSNKYQGPKPKGLQKGSSSSAGAATVIAATCLASQAQPSQGSVVSSFKAPQQPELKGVVGSSPMHDVKGVTDTTVGAVKRSLGRVRRKSNFHLPKVGMFEKAIKVFSAIAACVNPVLPQVNQEFLLDTGAGRNLISFKGMPEAFRQYVSEAPEKIQFATGGGMRPSAKALTLDGSLSGNNTFYALKDCPHALSVGIQVEQHRRPFIWVPGQLPYLVKADRARDLILHCPESAKIYASRVDENVPILSEQVTVASHVGTTAMPASSGGASGSKDPVSSEAPVPVPDPVEASRTPAHPSDLPRSSKPLELVEELLPHFGDEVDEVFRSEELVREVGDDPIDSDDEETNLWTPSLRERLQQEAKSAKHALTHFPKNRYCEICRRSKMLAKFHRKRGLEVDPEEVPPLHYGHKIRVDHIVLGRDLAKGSEGEQACLICYDEYSGCFGAFPQTKRDTDANIHALQKFGGTTSHGKALCVAKSDSAPELVDAIKYLGWLPNPSVPNDEVHNAKLERGIRSIKEGVRAILLKSGLSHEFWPRAIEYFCVAHSFSTQAPTHPNDSDEIKNRKNTENCYEAAVGETFTGMKLPFGCLVYYKPPKHRELPGFDPRTFPGIFVGWRMDAGFVHKGIHLVLDYESLRTNSKGCGRPIQVYQSELVEPNNGLFTFPLYEAEVQRLSLLMRRPSIPALEPRSSLPFDGPVTPVPTRKRRTYITLERAIKFGKTDGCRGCEKIAEGIPHSDKCHERFRVLLEEERLASEARAMRSSPTTPAPDTPTVPVPPTPAPDTPRVSSPSTPAPGAAMPKCPSCSSAPDPQVFAAPFANSHDDDQDSDYWVFDKDRKAWQRIHLRPRKRLYAPTGKDCPFDSSDVHVERITEWNCRNRKSTHKDNWQKTPHQRISQKSWTGSTWFYPKVPVDEQQAKLYAMSCNVANNSDIRKPRATDALFASLIAQAEDKHEAAEFIGRITRNVQPVEPPDARKRRPENPTCFEFCCSSDSTLGLVNMTRGINHFRLSSDVCNMADDHEVDSLIKIIEQFPGADIFGAIPCGPWSNWQKVNSSRYGKKFRKKLNKQRKKSLAILRNYIRCAEIVLRNGGHCAFEWPKGCDGWKIPELIAFCKKHSLFVAEPQGCALGLTDSKGQPHLKSWWIATSCWKLAMNLDSYRCCHPPDFKHAPLEGNATPKSAFYTEQMSQVISNSLYENTAPAMPVTVRSEPLPHDDGSHSLGPHAAVHLVLNRNEWHLHEGWDAAIKKELDGLLANQVWSFDEVVAREELVSRSKKENKNINIGRLMTILSVKNHETPSLRKLKARIVFRGDDIRTEDNTLAVLQEAKVNPTGLVGLNMNLMYGCCPGHHSSQSDVVRAYTQSLLKTLVETWVELPSELTPPEFSKLKRPCVKLVKSLYGHPESGYHWHNRFTQVMEAMEGVHMSNFQSSFWFPKSRMLLTLYVDDMVLSGPSGRHDSFWAELRKHLEIENPTKVERILGRKQVMFSDETGSYVEMSMEDFLESSCEAYENLTKTKIKESSTPYMPDGSLNTSDWETRGILSESASRILMKILWAARLCRPDFMKVIGDLTKKLTTWSVADDKRLHRLMGYVKHSKGYRLTGKVGDPCQALKLCLYTDADHCSGIDHTKSTSGMMMAIEGPSTWFPLAWSSRRQTATARSTTEAEMISLGSGLFSEAIPAQEFLENTFDRPVVLECLQDNSAVISIVAAGYSPKLRHLSKTQRIELGSIYEVFQDADTVLLYIKTNKQRADPLTKNLPPVSWTEALSLMGITPKSIEHSKP